MLWQLVVDPRRRGAADRFVAPRSRELNGRVLKLFRSSSSHLSKCARPWILHTCPHTCNSPWPIALLVEKVSLFEAHVSKPTNNVCAAPLLNDCALALSIKYVYVETHWARVSVDASRETALRARRVRMPVFRSAFRRDSHEGVSGPRLARRRVGA